MVRCIPESYGTAFKVNFDEYGYFWNNDRRRYATFDDAYRGYQYDRFFFKDKKRNAWRHRTPIKCIINPILRAIQFWTSKPYVICSICDYKECDVTHDSVPFFVKYSLMRVEYIKKQKRNVHNERLV